MKAVTGKALAHLTGSIALAVLVLAGTPAQAQDATTPYVGTIRYFGFSFAPVGWAFCDGQLLAISQNDALFSLIGTTYGGDGRTTFALPDMRGRFPIHQGHGAGLTSRAIGHKGGTETVTLTTNQIGHSHTLRGSSLAGNQSDPTGHTLATDANDNTYLVAAPDVQMASGSISTSTTPAAGALPHTNMAPFLGVYCNIALVGIYPSRS